MDQLDHVFCQILSERHPGTRWSVRPAEADDRATTATAREIVGLTAEGQDQDAVLDREATLA